MSPRSWVQAPHGTSSYCNYLIILFKNLKLELKIYYKGKTLSGSVPELGQRGVTQDHMHYASWVQIPPLPRPISSVGRAQDF